MAIFPGITLLASAARTASGTGSTVDLGAKMATVTARLEVTAASGTLPTLIVSLEHSKTGNTWVALGSAFAVVAAAGLWEATFENAERYVQVNWTIGGTSPSFTFSVTAEAEQLYATAGDLETELSSKTYRQIYDDNNDGTADPVPPLADIRDAQRIVDGSVRAIYALPIADPVPGILKTLTAELAAFLAESRFPKYARRHGKNRQAFVDDLLQRIAAREIRLDVPVEPTAATNEAFVVIRRARRGWGDS